MTIPDNKKHATSTEERGLENTADYRHGVEAANLGFFPEGPSETFVLGFNAGRSSRAA